MNKKYFAVIFVIFVCLMGVFLFPKEAISTAVVDYSHPSALKNDKQSFENTEYVRYLNENGEVETLTMEDYLIGSVLAQIHCDFEPEALKAQAVIAHTYILFRRNSENISPTKELYTADFSCDTNLYQPYFSKEQAQEFYKDKYDEYYEKVKECVKQCEDKICTYEGQITAVAFHTVSSGKTESAKDIWGTDIPYLVSKDSVWDKQVSGYSSTVKFTKEELGARIKSSIGIYASPKDISVENTSPNGSVLAVNIAGKQVSGIDFIIALNLNSMNWEMQADENSITFTTYGIGHLLGMSQCGANHMAKEGKNYYEILKYYFTGIDIISV